jgi:hypothetical protein
MSIQVSIQTIEATADAVFVTGKLIPSGNYVTGGINGGAGGDVIDFTKAVLDPLFSGIATAIPSSKAPTQLFAESQGGVLGYQYQTIIGSAQNNNKLVISALATFGSELASGAYPAVILADNIGFSAVFQKFQ